MKRPAPSAILVVALFAGCVTRSSDAEATQVIENAARSTGAATPASPSYSAEDPCPGSPGELVARLPEPPSALLLHEGRPLWVDGSLDSSTRDGESVERIPRDPAWVLRFVDVSSAGTFAVRQSERGPASTHLLWRAPDGTSTRSMEDPRVLLGDVRATPDGAFVLAGRVLDSPGPASQLLYFSTGTRTGRVLLDLERGASELTRDGDDLYWLEYPHTGRGQSGPSSVVGYRISDGSRRVLWQGDRVLSALVVAGGRTHWIERADLAEDRGRLVGLALSGGEVHEVLPSVPSHGTLVDRGSLVVRLEGRQRLHRVDPATGRTTLLLEDPNGIGLVAVDRGTIAWTTGLPDRGGVVTTCICRMELPPERPHEQ